MGEPTTSSSRGGAAPAEFDRAFDRWRELYNSARQQLMEANARSEITGLSAADRRRIKAAQMQASDQITILEQGKASNGSDFYSYRYLATEGFLPGYNFPRLPLYAFIPAATGATGGRIPPARALPRHLGVRAAQPDLSRRPRLPGHEGEAAAGSAKPERRELATKDIFICQNCGACHDGGVERCHACNSPMAGELPVQRTLRIDNVEAAPAERITANDEERVRQGFDIQTVFSWPRRDGRAQMTEADFRLARTSLLSPPVRQQRRDQPDQQGAKTRAQPDTSSASISIRAAATGQGGRRGPTSIVPPDVVQSVRIVPIVRDRKNALLLRFANPETHVARHDHDGPARPHARHRGRLPAGGRRGSRRALASRGRTGAPFWSTKPLKAALAC